ncbi:LOG family protein [Ferrovum sp.]|uniref:LOG family protein n=1 Tax=Ferrovum sp. TaxID=2609467 RepID=UPI002630F7D0|nr:LOG family protein [Ferrovum sp.]
MKRPYPYIIPSPPDPLRRKQPLPWSHPKRDPEDLQLEQRLKAILEHPSYREPDEDTDFIQSESARGVRLQLDYAKAEQGMRGQGIERCIVVFGSTRLREPALAERELAQIVAQCLQAPDDAQLARERRLAENRLSLARYYEVGRELGRLVGKTGNEVRGSRLVVMTGGGPGAMEAANRGAFEEGAPTIGLNITLPREQFPNPYITPGLCFQFHYFSMRKLHFMKRAVAIVALPGGYGTLDELFGALTLIQTRKVAPIPVVLVGEAYWRRVLDAEYMLDQGHIDAEDLDLYWYAETAAEAWEGIQHWHRENGSALI